MSVIRIGPAEPTYADTRCELHRYAGEIRLIFMFTVAEYVSVNLPAHVYCLFVAQHKLGIVTFDFADLSLIYCTQKGTCRVWLCSDEFFNSNSKHRSGVYIIY